MVRYGLALFSVGLALLIGWATPLGEFSPTTLFFAAVMISSWYGGLGPGLLATVLSTLSIDLFLVPQTLSLIPDLGDAARIAVFILVAVLISWLNGVRRRLEESLRERNVELTAAHRQKDAFLATVGHELRNLLAPVYNGLNVLRLRGDQDEFVAPIIGIAERRVRHMTRLVDDLLDVSRITQGKLRLEVAPVELAALVSDAVETSRPLIEARRHRLDVALPSEPIWLEGDPARLEQVLINLLNNAAKYTEPGGRISLSAAREADEVVLRVRDTGAGIAPELLPRVFELYAQGEHSPTGADAGLGIGLSLVRNLIQMHGGTVEARSAGPGRGSEFVVRLPALQEPRALEQPAPETAELEGPRLRILVVDDNIDAARLLAMMLQMWGHEVRTVHDGPSAIDAAQECHPAVVLLDIGLPGMHGYDVARRLRQRFGPEQLMLIALTGHADDGDRRRSRDAGCDEHLTKPIDVTELKRLLAQPSPVASRQGSPTT